MKTILLKIDEDNDIFEMRIGNEVYTLESMALIQTFLGKLSIPHHDHK